jgi:hypothetical protein
MSLRPTALAVLTSAALSLFALQPSASAAEVKMLRLVDASSVEIPAELAKSPAVAPVRLNLAALEDRDQRLLSLPLPDGRVLRVERTDVERRGRRDYAWRGNVIGDEGQVEGHVTLTVLGKLVQGRVSMSGKIWNIQPEAGRHWVAQHVAPELPCGANEPSEIAPLLMKAPAQTEGGVPPELATAAADGFTRLRLVVVYPRASTLGDTNRLLLQIRNAVDTANTAMTASGIQARIDLITIREVNHQEQADPVDDLIYLYEDPAMIALRRSSKALLTTIITVNSGVCGIANLMDRDELEGRATPLGVSLVRRSCLNDQTLMHELGHNLGAQHDPVNAQPPSQALFPYSFGHFKTGAWRTIMSYSTECGGEFGCPRIDHISNPDISFNGDPTGIPNQRDNTRVIEATRGRWAVSATPGSTCRPGPDRLCLLKKRFQVELEWQNQFNGTSGTGRSLARSDAAGFFSFGDPSNLELMVKLLDFGDVVKVFWGQLTNLRYRLIVTDLKTGQAKTYQNTPGECGGIDQGAFPGGGGLDLLSPQANQIVSAAAGCKNSSGALCLDNRFTVSVNWRNPGNGTSGQAVAVPFSKVTGAFHFGNPSNLELMTKVITQGDRVDFFWGALSDLEYTIDVTDTQTGQVKTYQNAAGRYCGGLQVDAF